MKQGLIEAKSGIRFAPAGWSNFVQLAPPSIEPASSVTIKLPTALPGTAGVWQVDSTGASSFVTLGTAAYVGEIRLFGMSTLPLGWVACDGSAKNRTGTYANLFAAIGTTWGAGDGSTTFNLPDAQGRGFIGAGAGSGLTARTIGATGGEEAHALTAAENGPHTHQSKGSGFITNGTSSDVAQLAPTGTGGNNWAVNSFTQSSGSGTPHNNMQPFVVAQYAICYDSILASASAAVLPTSEYEYATAGTFNNAITLTAALKAAYKTMRLIGTGSGGGGGSGRRGAAGTVRTGGGGGSSGGAFDAVFSLSEFPDDSTLSIVVGAGGAGAAAVSATSTNGAIGSNGNATTITIKDSGGSTLLTLTGFAGLGGVAGGTGSVPATASASVRAVNGSNYALSASTGPNASNVQSGSGLMGAGAGGIGATINAGNAVYAGGNGGIGSVNFGTTEVGTIGGAVYGGNGASATTTGLKKGQLGNGGAGGAGGNTTTTPNNGGGNGGDGVRGGGGGGGGAGVDGIGTSSGAGGNGGAGYAYIRFS
jgi:microcystin-dependent protein